MLARPAIERKKPEKSVDSAKSPGFCRHIPLLSAKFATMRLSTMSGSGGNAMNNAEKAIMRQFRLYRIGVNEMLCFNAAVANANTAQFQSAIASLVRNGLVIKERRRNAFSLTAEGFAASQSI
jgi:hypothetical protein